MAHFVKLDENNVVFAVHLVNNDALDPLNEEASGIEFLTNLHGPANWKQTSYNRSIRKNYAGIGFTYDEARDAFIPPKPFNSWILDEETCRWDAPTPYPQDGKRYTWSEDTVSWQEIE